jgi:hypothetical protein
MCIFFFALIAVLSAMFFPPLAVVFSMQKGISDISGNAFQNAMQSTSSTYAQFSVLPLHGMPT